MMERAKPEWFEMIKNSHGMLWPGLVFVVAAFLRLYGLARFSFSNDELSALYRIDVPGFGALIRDGVYPDFHPAGVQVLLYYWTSLFGMSEAWVRLPFALMGAFSVLLVYQIGRRWHGELPALVAAALLAVLEYPVLYSSIARPYASGLFLILLTVWLWNKFVLEEAAMSRKAKIGRMIAFGFSLAACMYDHYFCFLTAAMVGITGLWMVRKPLLPFYLGAGFISVLLFLPHLPISLAHFSIGGLSTWLGKPDILWPVQHWLYIFNGTWFWAAPAILLLGMSTALSGIRRERGMPGMLGLAWWVILLLIGWTYSNWINPVLQHTILLFAFPFMLLSLSSVTRLIKQRHRNWMVPLILGAGLLHMFGVSHFYDRQHFADFRDTGNFVLQVLEENPDEDIAWAANINNRWYIDHYLGDRADEVQFLVTDIRDMHGVKRLLNLVDSLTPSSLVYLSLKTEPMELHYALQDRYPSQRAYKNHDGCSWYAWFSHDGGPAESMLPEPDRVMGKASPTTVMNSCDWNTLAEAHAQGSIFLLDADKEYGEALVVSLDTLPGVRWVHASVSGCYLDDQGDPQLVLSVEDQHGAHVLWRSSSFKFFHTSTRWGGVHLYYDISSLGGRAKKLSVYVWNHGQRPVYVDEVRVELGYR